MEFTGRFFENMIALCIEASHERGMGHLYRAINFIRQNGLERKDYILLINNDEKSLAVLESNAIAYTVVDYSDFSTKWEWEIIDTYKVSIWLNDKFESSFEMCKSIKEKGILLATIDDRGKGAELADIHFAPMVFGDEKDRLLGKNILRDMRYNILNPEICQYQRVRAGKNNMIICLGGSDTYGVTLQVLDYIIHENLKNADSDILDVNIDVLIGAGFCHEKELNDKIEIARAGGLRIGVYKNVPSLVELFSKYDLAITGGGVTCFEAASSGIPPFIIANEIHEIEMAKSLEKIGAAVFLGYYKNVKFDLLNLDNIDIEKMSKAGISELPLSGAKNIYDKLMNC